MSLPTLGIIGGTGAEGRGLALRLAARGYPVVIGSRSVERGQAAAQDLAAQLAGSGASVQGGTNEEAAAAGDIVFLTVPYEAHESTLRELAGRLEGKLLVDVTAPVSPPRVDVYQPPAGGSAAQEAAAILGPDTPVIAAFQNVAAGKLQALGQPVNCDVLVCGDDSDAKARVMALAQAMGLQAYDAGALANAAVVEGMTAVLIALNKRYGSKNAGLRITNLPESAAPETLGG